MTRKRRSGTRADMHTSSTRLKAIGQTVALLGAQQLLTVQTPAASTSATDWLPVRIIPPSLAIHNAPRRVPAYEHGPGLTVALLGCSVARAAREETRNLAAVDVLVACGMFCGEPRRLCMRAFVSHYERRTSATSDVVPQRSASSSCAWSP